MAAYPYLDNNIIKYGHPNLRGVISMMASPNLYEDDIYFINSCLHMDEYELGMDLDICIPGIDHVDDDNLENTFEFQNRFSNLPWSRHKFSHFSKDEYWTSRSPKYENIEIPIFLIGGWYYGYRYV